MAPRRDLRRRPRQGRRTVRARGSTSRANCRPASGRTSPAWTAIPPRWCCRTTGQLVMVDRGRRGPGSRPRPLGGLSHRERPHRLGAAAAGVGAGGLVVHRRDERRDTILLSTKNAPPRNCQGGDDGKEEEEAPPGADAAPAGDPSRTFGRPARRMRRRHTNHLMRRRKDLVAGKTVAVPVVGRAPREDPASLSGPGLSRMGVPPAQVPAGRGVGDRYHGVQGDGGVGDSDVSGNVDR